MPVLGERALRPALAGFKLSAMLPVESYEWVWLLALAVIVIGAYLERRISANPVARFLLSSFWTVLFLALGVWAFAVSKALPAFVFFVAALGAAVRTAVLYAKRSG